MRTVTALAACLALAACKKDAAPRKDPAPAPTTAPEPTAPTTPTPTTPAPTTPAPAAFQIAIGDATVYELVDRTWQKRDPPTRDLVMHPNGAVEVINDKTGEAMLTMTIALDGTVGVGGKQVARINEHDITDLGSNQPFPVTIDGDTASVDIDGKVVKVVLAADGNITVLDRPDGTKWRIDAKDPAVMRTMFRVLAMHMKTALD